MAFISAHLTMSWYLWIGFGLAVGLPSWMMWFLRLAIMTMFLWRLNSTGISGLLHSHSPCAVLLSIALPFGTMLLWKLAWRTFDRHFGNKTSALKLKTLTGLSPKHW